VKETVRFGIEMFSRWKHGSIHKNEPKDTYPIERTEKTVRTVRIERTVEEDQ
jgi:hypothetical protein